LSNGGGGLMDSNSRVVTSCDRMTVPAGTHWRRWLAASSVAVLVGLSTVACDRDSTASNGPNKRNRPAPSTQPAEKPSVPIQSVAAPVPPQGVTAYLYFQYPQGGNPLETGSEDAASPNPLGLPHAFPPARLRLTQRDDGVTGLLFTDDPKEAALSKDWAGDRFYFQFPLQASDLAAVNGAEWWHQASAAEREESPNGVYLRGDRYHLEATNVLIRIDGQVPNMMVRIRGDFMQYDTMDAHAKPVPGVLLPRVETKD
jgi:hypothetical protein